MAEACAHHSATPSLVKNVIIFHAKIDIEKDKAQGLA
jgi:hypothetical protein